MFWVVVLGGIVVSADSSSGVSADSPSAKPVQVLGTYGNPAEFWKHGGRLREFGINAVFNHHGLPPEQTARAHREGAWVFAEFGVFRNQRLVKERPELWPIDSDGKPISPTERFLGLCPTNERYNREKLQELKRLMRQRELAGVWLDYLHFHCDFELPDPPLVQSCFNDSCLRRFEKDTGIRLQGKSTADKAGWILENNLKEWTDWKCSVITDFARRVRELIDAECPGMLLGIYSCPWTDDEYDGGMRKIVAEDIAKLARHIDVFSPMVYHGNCERSADWAARYTLWLRRKLNRLGARCRIWPIVQGGGTPRHRPPVTPDGFRTALEGALEGGGSGVMFYHFTAVARETPKLGVLRQVYTQLAARRQTEPNISAAEAELLARITGAMSEGRLSAALESCSRAVRNNGSLAEAWELMGQIYKRTGRELQAASCFRRAAFERGDSPPVEK